MESYSLATLWHERQRYLPGVLAVAFSALLIALQCGLLLGLFAITSIPIDHTAADPSARATWPALPASPRSSAARATSRASPTGPSPGAAPNCAWSSARAS